MSTSFLDERVFFRLVRHAASLATMNAVDQMEAIFKEKPHFLQYKLRQNYCVECGEYQTGLKNCQEPGCSANGYCIPRNNSLGKFFFDICYVMQYDWLIHSSDLHLDENRLSK